MACAASQDRNETIYGSVINQGFSKTLTTEPQKHSDFPTYPYDPCEASFWVLL